MKKRLIALSALVLLTGKAAFAEIQSLDTPPMFLTGWLASDYSVKHQDFYAQIRPRKYHSHINISVALTHETENPHLLYEHEFSFSKNKVEQGAIYPTINGERLEFALYDLNKGDTVYIRMQHKGGKVGELVTFQTIVSDESGEIATKTNTAKIKATYKPI